MKVFVAGPRAVSRLNHEVKERLKNIINNNLTILVGDANGVDKQVQKYYHSLNYDNVRVYASNGKARNNIGEWKVENVEVGADKKGFDFYAAKDEAMAKTADYGFMIWNGKSKGTLNNMANLVHLNKKVLVYLIPHKQFYTITSLEEIIQIIKKDDNGHVEPKHEEILNKFKQQSLFS